MRKLLNDLKVGDSVKIVSTYSAHKEERKITRITKTQLITEKTTQTGTHEEKFNKKINLLFWKMN